MLTKWHKRRGGLRKACADCMLSCQQRAGQRLRLCGAPLRLCVVERLSQRAALVDGTDG